MLTILIDIEKHVSSGADHAGSLIFAEDAPAGGNDYPPRIEVAA
jgi:hypothetical protein